VTAISPGKLLGLRRLADAEGRFKMLAVDQRPPIETLVAQGRGADFHTFEDVARLKGALIGELGGAATALLLDPQYVFPAALWSLPRGAGLLITLENDSFEVTARGRRSRRIDDWTVAKIKRAGGDAVKVLAWYRPDADPAVIEHQQRFVAAVGEECVRYDIPFVFELLVYPFPDEENHTTGHVEHTAKRTEHVLESVETFARPSFGVDLFKVESPVSASAISTEDDAEIERVSAAFAELGKAAGRPWVMLSAGADTDTFRRILGYAYRAGASGYLAGRAIWWEACADHFPDWEAMSAALETDALPYMKTINTLTDRDAAPWFAHPCFGEEGAVPPPAGPEFRSSYLAEWS
jgi:tagatose 1,6-diphosphate aldolase